MSVEPNETRTRLTFLLLVALVLAVFFLVSSMDRISRLFVLQTSIGEMEQSIDWAGQRNLELLDELQYIASPAYVDEVARGELGYSRAGDEVIIVLEPAPESHASAAQSHARTAASQVNRLFLLDINWWRVHLGLDH